MIGLLSALSVLAALDTLPPLPEPSELPVHEPTLWTELAPYRLLVSGYAGGRFGGSFKYTSDRDSIDALYQNENDWCLIRLAKLSARRKFSIGFCDLYPCLDAMGAFMGFRYWTWEGTSEHRGLYRFGYGISAAIFTTAAVLEAGSRQNIWRIDTTDHFEDLCTLSVYLDRSRFLPQLVINTLYQSGRWQPEGMFRIHPGPIHAGIGALLRFDSLSTQVDIAYRDVDNMARVMFKQGLVPRPFQKLVDPQVPIRYDFPGPAERIGWMVEVGAGHVFPAFTASAGFRHRDDWDRCGLSDDYHIALFEGVRENAGFVTASCSLMTGEIVIIDSCLAEYAQVQPGMPFVPRYRISNNLRIAFRSLFAGVGLLHLSKRPGFHHTLAAVTLLDGRIGYRFHSCRVFMAVYNISDRQVYVYDTYSAKSRTVAAGFEFVRP